MLPFTSPDETSGPGKHTPWLALRTIRREADGDFTREDPAITT